MVNIEIDWGAGFCFGVEQVVKTAESILENGEVVYGLGEMVHNSQEVQRLYALGLRTLDYHELASVKPERILLRAHGEPPSTYKLAKTHGIEIIDGTCPIVARLQKKVKQAYESMNHDSEQLVIFGKADHPETIGLLGQVNGDAVVVSSHKDVAMVDASKKVTLFSQTTMDPDQFREVENALRRHLKGISESSFRSECTICGQMKKRKPGLASFAVKHDLILFVSGKHSSNGRMLYEFCKTINPKTYWISSESDIDPGWFPDAGSIGISGATSTSRSQLESVSKHVKNFTSS